MLFVHFRSNIFSQFTEPFFCRRHTVDHLLVLYKRNHLLVLYKRKLTSTWEGGGVWQKLTKVDKGEGDKKKNPDFG